MKTCPVCDTPFPDPHNTCPTDGAVLIDTHELEPGHIVKGKYRIVRKLGQGGMGIVYLAEHLLLGDQLALKFLGAALSKDLQFVKRFRNEARAAYRLNHPNIVQVTDLDQDEVGTLFIAMEYVAGPNLRTVLREAKGPFPLNRSLEIVRGVASGLAAAHARGAVHRDIKPENILVRIEGGGEIRPKVLDFGIASMADSITNLSRTHGLLLTPEYASPEQWRGTPANQLDGRADLYALGCVFYEMLAGRKPYEASNPEGWMFQHLQGVPVPIGTLRPELSTEYPALDSIVMRLMARERDQRFASATAFLEALSAPSTADAPVAPHISSVPSVPKPTAAVTSGSTAQAHSSHPEPVQATGPRIAPPDIAHSETRPDEAPYKSERVVVSKEIPEPVAPKAKNWFVVIAVASALGIFAIALIAWNWSPSQKAAVPKLTPGAGTYPTPMSVSITDDTPGAVIHYTLDGSQPTESSPIYSEPLIDLKNGAAVRAFAIAEGYKPSSIVTADYFWSEGAIASAIPQNPNNYDEGKNAYEHKRYSQARTLFSQACDGGDLRACSYLGYMYAQGQGGPADMAKARAAYQGACDKGGLPSCANLGVLYQDDGNSLQAKQYFQKACDGKYQHGCELLKGLK